MGNTGNRGIYRIFGGANGGFGGEKILAMNGGARAEIIDRENLIGNRYFIDQGAVDFADADEKRQRVPSVAHVALRLRELGLRGGNLGAGLRHLQRQGEMIFEADLGVVEPR